MGYKSDAYKADRTEESVDFPKVILIDNCNACNLKCSMCDHINVKNYRKIQIMDFSLYTSIIDEISTENPNVRVWQIFFGDPFMCHDIAKRIRYAKDRGLTDVVLNSNGVKMNAQRAKNVIEAGLDAMYVGIDAFRAETYTQIRIGGSFDTAVANVLGYRDLLKKYGRPEQQLFVQFVVSSINEEEVEDFKRFWTEKGVNVKVRPKISWAGLVGARNLVTNDRVERKPCYWLMQTMNICADGTVALCSVDLHRRVNCGDVTQSSLKEIWHDQLKHYRQLHRQHRFAELPEMCRNCSDWQSAYADYLNAPDTECAALEKENKR